MIPYGRQSIDDDDIAAVVRVLHSDRITQGMMVEKFEASLADYCGAKYAVVCSSGTAALHAAFVAAGVGAGDEFITTPITFPATSNVGIWQGARPVFVDVDPQSGNIDVNKIEPAITDRTKAIVPVDYAGRPVDLDKIKEIAKHYNLPVIEDACQALSARFQGKKVGSISDFTTFSFHPAKHITTGEGGAVLTDNEEHYRRMKRFVNHGVEKEYFKENSPGDWYFEMQELGLNYRLTDFQSALGLSQLQKADSFLEKRRKIADFYFESFDGLKSIGVPLTDDEVRQSSWHLYPVRVERERRRQIFHQLRQNGIWVQVHHIPVYRHPYYRNLGYQINDYPNTEKFYEQVISLPIYPDLTMIDQERVVEKLNRCL